MNKTGFIKNAFLFFLILAFFAGLYVFLYQIQYTRETFRNDDSAGYVGPDDGTSKCPDLLISSGGKLLLLNTTIPQIEGKNPIVFDSLDDYIKYLEVQKQRGSSCPVLYLQQETDAQGKDVYRIQPSKPYWESGLPPIYDPTNNKILSPDRTVPVKVNDADRLNPPYNANNYPGFDSHGQYIGVKTDMDARHYSTKTSAPLSDNPMDPNWGGVAFTQSAVDSGKYAGEEVVKPLTQGKINVDFIPINYNKLNGSSGYDYGVDDADKTINAMRAPPSNKPVQSYNA